MGVGFWVATMVIVIGLGPQQDALEFFGNKMKPRQWVSGRETAAPKKSKADEAAEFLANAHGALTALYSSWVARCSRRHRCLRRGCCKGQCLLSSSSVSFSFSLWLLFFHLRFHANDFC